MKPVHVFFIILFYLPFFGYSQGEFNNWYFGDHEGITFQAGAPVFLPGNPMYQGGEIQEACVSDSAGNLLFFTNGRKVWNKNKQVMPNGYDLLGGQIKCQPVVAVPFVSDPNKFYLFTHDFQEPVPFPIEVLRYSVLDMLLDGGKGDIVSGMKNIPLPKGDSAVTQLTTIRGSVKNFV